MVLWKGVRVRSTIPLRWSLEQALLIRRLWAWRIGKRLGRCPSPLGQTRRLHDAVCRPARSPIACHRGPVWILRFEAGARAGRGWAGARRARGRPSMPVLFWWSGISARAFPLAQRRVSSRGEDGLLWRSIVVWIG